EQTDQVQALARVPDVDPEPDELRAAREDLLHERQRTQSDGRLEDLAPRSVGAQVRPQAAEPHRGMRVASVERREDDVAGRHGAHSRQCVRWTSWAARTAATPAVVATSRCSGAARPSNTSTQAATLRASASKS